MTIASTISFKFEGGIADEHELNFYEAARFQYATARLLYKLENFRQTGHVLQRVTKNIDADIRVSTPQEGSWELEVFSLVVPVAIAIDVTCDVPLDALFAYILKLVKPPSKGHEVAVRIAEEMTKKDIEHSKQIGSIERIVERQQATTQQALTIVQDLINRRDYYHGIVTGLPDEEEADFLCAELEAELEQNNIIQKHHKVLSEITPDQEERLADEFRKGAGEMAKPLERSATKLSISAGGEHSCVGVFDYDGLKSLTKEIVSDVPVSILGSVKAYDKETGWGKFRSTGLSYKPIPFKVPSSLKNENLISILRAFVKSEVIISFYTVKKKNGEIVRLIFDKIIKEDELG